jgi:hypothetical protein
MLNRDLIIEPSSAERPESDGFSDAEMKISVTKACRAERFHAASRS